MPVTVVAAIIERDERFLVTRRPPGTHLEGCWEFPGGKGHPSETRPEALRRELLEELDIVAEVGELVLTVTHEYPEKTVELHFYRCRYVGEPKAMLGQEMRWVSHSELATLTFPEGDATLIELLSWRAEHARRGPV